MVACRRQHEKVQRLVGPLRKASPIVEGKSNSDADVFLVEGNFGDVGGDISGGKVWLGRCDGYFIHWEWFLEEEKTLF